ncbi:MAG: nucleoside-diphosphate kinase [bacterium]
MKEIKKNAEQILVLIKPDALIYSLTGFIIERISAVFNPIIAATKITNVLRELAEEHYSNIKGAPYFETTIKYIMGELHYPNHPEKRRVMAIVYEGEGIVDKIKAYFGPTRPKEAKRLAKEEGIITLRSQLSYTDYSVSHEELIENAVHASQDVKEAEREIKLWFKPSDLPKQYRIFDYVEGEEFFYYINNENKQPQIIGEYYKGARCIVAPGDYVWKTDYDNLKCYKNKDSNVTLSLNSIIAKYIHL